MNFAMKMPPNHSFMLNGVALEPVSRTYQYRKIMKPMLERKRRARINKCLDELKDLMTGTLQADGENVSKLEKADILELTVRHLHRLREHNGLFLRHNDAINMDKFWAGFQHCAAEVSQFLNKYDRNIGGDLVKYIANYMPNIAANAALAAANGSISPTATATLTAARNYNKLRAVAQNKLPLEYTPTQSRRYDDPPRKYLPNQAAIASRKLHAHPYARCKPSSHDESVSESESDGDLGGVWRPW